MNRVPNMFLRVSRGFATNTNPKVFMDIKIGTKPAGRVVFEVRRGRSPPFVEILTNRNHTRCLRSSSATSCPKRLKIFVNCAKVLFF